MTEWSGDRRALLLGGAVIAGGLTGGGLDYAWFRAGQGTRVDVLGAGKRVAVLITHNQRRVLIASGTDGSAFANVTGAAIPPVGGTLDVLLLDPDASADVRPRASKLDHHLLLTLPRKDSTSADTIRHPFRVELGRDVALAVELESDADWSAILQFNGDRVRIVPAYSGTRTPAPVTICLAAPTGTLGSEGWRFGPPGPTDDQTYSAVSAGERRTIRLTADNLWFDRPR